MGIKPCPMPCYSILLTGKSNGMIPETPVMSSESFTMTDVTIFHVMFPSYDWLTIVVTKLRRTSLQTSLAHAGVKLQILYIIMNNNTIQ